MQNISLLSLEVSVWRLYIVKNIVKNKRIVKIDAAGFRRVIGFTFHCSSTNTIMLLFVLIILFNLTRPFLYQVTNFLKHDYSTRD